MTDYSGATRTYTLSYVTDSNYTFHYLRNLLSAATVTPSSGSAMTLASNVYDDSSGGCGYGLQDQQGAEHVHDRFG